MRAHLVGLAIAATLAPLLAAAPSVAATRVEGPDLEAAGIRVVSQGCTDSAALPPRLPVLRTTPDPQAPLGGGAVGWTPRIDGFEVGPMLHIDSPSTLTKLSVDVVGRSGAPEGHLLAEYQPPGDEGWWRGTSVLKVGSPGWRRVVAEDLSYRWRYVSVTGEVGEFAPEAKLQTLVSASGGDGDGAWVGFAFGCDGGTFDVDALKVQTATESRTIDFEPYSAKAGLSGGGKHKLSIIAGARPKLKATLADRAGETVTGKVSLQRAAKGSKKYRTVDTFKVGKTGTAMARIKPLYSATYRLKYAGTSSRVPSTSKPVTVRVHSNVRARLAQSAIVQGRPLTVTGRFWPGRSARLSLQKYVHGSWKTMRKLRSAKDGTFRVSAPTTQVGKSYWRITVPKGGGNADGRSVSMKLVTKARPKPPHHGGGGGTPTPTPTNPDPPTNDPDNPKPPTTPV